LCTDDVSRIARVTGVGMVVEADRAQRARDLGEEPEELDAVTRAQIHMDRLSAVAESGGPVERAWLAIGDAELARAKGHSDHAKWLAAASEWDALERPYWAAIARWRAAEALVDGGDRAGAAETARAALETARRLGSEWLTAQLTGLASRARLELDHEHDGDGTPATAEDGDPFGLTPRERQVLALLAEGATNRQIGSALYMAEKTASVHVSRILSKLGVNTRTQAAAVAHRQNLD
jgi:DNA-binding CsgD family transcriptional regulator